jgi:hypothetical protein
MDLAIQNLESLRQLIAEVRASQEAGDMDRLRMLQYVGLGSGAMTNESEGV